MKNSTKKINSANTIFHFTNKYSNLLNIFKKGFYPCYSLEDFSCSSVDGFKLAIPMVSFCDIPISRASKHSSIYGSYAIGLNKNWGEAMKLQPVIYTYSSSNFSTNMRNCFDRKDNIGFLFETLVYTKPYLGSIQKMDNVVVDNVMFYDEREWRYVPSSRPLACLDEKRFWKEKKNYIRLKATKETLKFQAFDIKYIVVKKEKEIPKLVSFLFEFYKDVYTYSDLQVLITKIISLDNIIEDF